MMVPPSHPKWDCSCIETHGFGDPSLINDIIRKTHREPVGTQSLGTHHSKLPMWYPLKTKTNVLAGGPNQLGSSSPENRNRKNSINSGPTRNQVGSMSAFFHAGVPQAGYSRIPILVEIHSDIERLEPRSQWNHWKIIDKYWEFGNMLTITIRFSKSTNTPW